MVASTFDEGFFRAQEAVERLLRERDFVVSLLEGVRSAVLPEDLKKHSVSFRRDHTQLLLLDEGTGNEIARLAFDTSALSFHYSEFRCSTKYPLPANEQSVSLAAKYFGGSCALFRALQDYPELELGDSLAVRKPLGD